jgi:hypothetical protein
MEFVDKGVYRDDDMPDIETFRNLAMGTRESPLIDVSPAFDVIDEINSGWIGWYSRPIAGTEVEVLTSLDGNKWDKMINGQYIQNAKHLNDDPNIYLKYVIRSYISQIIPEDSPKLYNVVLILSDKQNKSWNTEIYPEISWDNSWG